MAGLQLENIVKEYPTRGEPLRVLDGVSLQLEPGQNVAVVGPSGSGKSTLLHIAGALDDPTSGRVWLDDTDPFSLDPAALANFRNEKVGFVFQEHHLLPQLSALENVLVPALAKGSADEHHLDRAGQLLERVGLADRRDHRPAELSGGERQRVAVARALMLQPSLLLADEPTGSLDRSTATAIGDLLLQMQAHEQTMLVVVTHSQALADLLQRQLEIDGGKLMPR